MKNVETQGMLSQELEAVFKECQDHIQDAVRAYEKDIHSAIDELKTTLSIPNVVSN